MSDLPELQRLLLKRLSNAKGQKLGGAQFHLYANDRKRLGADETQIQAAREEVVQQGFVTERKSGGGRSYQLTPAGTEFLRTPSPPPSGHDESLLPYHKTFLLLLLLRSEERKSSLASICSRLDTQTAKGLLGFGRVASQDRVLVNRPLVAWILDTLAVKGAATRTECRGVPSYQLTEAGEELLGASEHYPTIKFTMTGEELNELAAAIRLSRKAVAGLTSGNGDQQPETPPTVLGPRAEDVLAEFEQLKREQYAQHGMVPIYALRQVIAERFGIAAADHASLDPLLQELRRKRQIRLIALGDPATATEQQLAASIAGENETFFAIESTHEHAHV